MVVVLNLRIMTMVQVLLLCPRACAPYALHSYLTAQLTISYFLPFTSPVPVPCLLSPQACCMDGPHLDWPSAPIMPCSCLLLLFLSLFLPPLLAMLQLIVVDVFHVAISVRHVFDGKFAKQVLKVSSSVTTVMFTLLAVSSDCFAPLSLDFYGTACLFSSVWDAVNSERPAFFLQKPLLPLAYLRCLVQQL